MTRLAVSEFYREVVDAFRGLVDLVPIRIESSVYDPANFGNAFVVLAAPAFRIRLIRDRDEPSAEVSSPEDPEDWLSLDWVIAEITGGPPPPPRNITPLQAADLVARHLDALGAGLSGAPRKVLLLERDQSEIDRARELFGDEGVAEVLKAHRYRDGVRDR